MVAKSRWAGASGQVGLRRGEEGVVHVGVLVVVEGGVVSDVRHLLFLLLPRFCAIVRSHHAQYTWQEVEKN